MPKSSSVSLTVAQCIERGAQRFEAAGLFFGHGTDNAFDEAAELVFFAAGLRHEDAPRVYGRRLQEDELARIEALIERRVRERIPAAYLTRRMWFAGHEFYVDERVLVPRSPIAELIEARFEPWIQADKVHSILDIGTGSGCIAIACALAFPQAGVDATDISQDALDVARINIERHKVADRVRAIGSDVWENLDGRRYDVIVTNPPYVSRAELESLPDEYRREPQLGLLGGTDGLDIVRRIIEGAADHLNPGGILIGEVGNTEDALQAAFPDVPFVWLEFERGGGGVFVLTRDELERLKPRASR
ncbi:MAG TPA: 50S ribosomal protein L3 N(5)-glutamine methyltransferase [Steroidobacteraceae bacterium]